MSLNLNKILELGQSKLYWIFLLALGLVLESVALFFQYGLDEWPCVLCIHVRIWVLSFMIVALMALLVRKGSALNTVSHIVTTIIMIVLAERSWKLLAIERGWIFEACDMNLGTPAWLALDKWFPVIFEVQTSCGYTPQLLFGITMAEALMVMSVVLVLASAAFSISCFLKNKSK